SRPLNGWSQYLRPDAGGAVSSYRCKRTGIWGGVADDWEFEFTMNLNPTRLAWGDSILKFFRFGIWCLARVCHCAAHGSLARGIGNPRPGQTSFTPHASRHA